MLFRSGQRNLNDTVLVDNAGIYPPGSPFLVKPNRSNRILTNLGLGLAALRLDWELVSWARNAELAETKQELTASRARYGNRLRQLQLDVSLAYYQLQLGQQLRRVRQVQLASDVVVRDEVQALYRSGLVPRVDSLRAEAQVQQSRMKLEQATALVLSRQRQRSNLINAPTTLTLTASEAVRLQPPWPLDLQQTLVHEFLAALARAALDVDPRLRLAERDEVTGGDHHHAVVAVGGPAAVGRGARVQVRGPVDDVLAAVRVPREIGRAHV